MAKLGSEKRPVIVRVRLEDRAREIAEFCSKSGLHYIIGIEPNMLEDVSDIETVLKQRRRAPTVSRPSRNAACPCGSGRKYKSCCARVSVH